MTNSQISGGEQDLSTESGAGRSSEEPGVPPRPVTTRPPVSHLSSLHTNPPDGHCSPIKESPGKLVRAPGGKSQRPLW